MDFREDFTPLQAGLDALSPTIKRRIFIGKQAAVNERQTGALQKRINLAVDAMGRMPTATNRYSKTVRLSVLLHRAATVTRLAKVSPWGYVKTEAADAGGEFAVEILGDMRPATVQTEPAYDPAGLKCVAREN